MRIGSPDGTSIEITPVDYQFGDTGDRWDGNWLVIQGTVTTPPRSWSFRDPCLTTFEARELGDWLRAAAAGRVSASMPSPDGTFEPDLWFTEPNLAFSVAARRGDIVTVRVHLSLEALPPVQPQADLFHFFVEIPVHAIELDNAAAAWAADLKAFPVRDG